ncbi:helicase-related protein [Mucilaginibacter rubeus]|uniref:Helicase n=1 Tax=Mucilaginibacter rubeus TaxID=2027860 RepID=A0A5C1HW98_9SPHI|nr:helicase-related protein [Mucilaginibacter rubeus]QEM09078.1 helicase [Mucilaginibacter rubeus]
MMIKEKRKGLERFLTEQALGPGASGYRYLCVDDVPADASPLTALQGLGNERELLNIVPGAIYSTGILFPIDDSSVVQQAQAQSDDQDAEDDEDVAGQPVDPQDDDDRSRIDQMFPNMMGMTCCFDDRLLGSDDLRIRVQARYYIKVDPKKEEAGHYGVLCELDSGFLGRFLEQLGLAQRFRLVVKGANVIITYHPLRGLPTKDIRRQLRNAGDTEAQRIAGELRAAGHNLPPGQTLSAIKQSCYYALKFELTDQDQIARIYTASQQIEQIECGVNHLYDLMELFDGGYGIWRSQVVDVLVPFPVTVPQVVGRKMIYTCNELSRNYQSSLKDIFRNDISPDAQASLSLNLQLSQDSRRADDKVFLKVQLLNTSTHFQPNGGRYYSTFNEVVNERTFFGVKISITDERLVPYNTFELSEEANLHDEDNITRSIYRQYEDYGIGHGCSVRWETRNGRSIETEYIPSCDTPDIDTVPKDKETPGDGAPADILTDTTALQFKWLSHLSDTTDEEVLSGLKEFVASYGTWIIRKRQRYAAVDGPEGRIAAVQLDRCEADQQRMLANITGLLEGAANADNLMDLRLMNSSMFMQLWHSVNVKAKQVQDVFSADDFEGFDRSFYEAADVSINGRTAAWRAFQLAFILLNLDGVFEPSDGQPWTIRNEQVDLVWFPTGGGKTEAYLGIISLTILYRRRKYGASGGGTAAIMRYTLRLLTLQQFQRATLVIMALELMRRWDPVRVGQEPIYIGLWVGDGSLPNSLPDLQEEFNKLAAKKASRVPFQSCPWCGSDLTPSAQIEGPASAPYDHNRIHLFCAAERCCFSFPDPFAQTVQGGLPVALCDEVIYQHPPALVFGTVDKFAQLAHKVTDLTTDRNKDSRRIFGTGDWERGKPADGYLPPDLIIQDELHLLLGPLGSAVALFESAVDQLCTRSDGTRPKVISSTATTRNTPLQIMALFDRKVSIFPQPGPECDDSFFAFYKREHYGGGASADEYLSKRRYLGILPTGRTQIWMQMRIAAIFMTHRALFELERLGNNGPLDAFAYETVAPAMDYYHTIISYFNSLKEVGKTESQVQTYLIKEVRRVFNRAVRPGRLMHGLYTYAIRSAELTGRLSGEEVANELRKVGERWSAPTRFAHMVVREDGPKLQAGFAPPDLVVATNMISVGIDVSRFNTMIVNSMPRNIAEYIQASSRVARDEAGLVVTIHHPFRARDVSHYEKFIEFHEKMYSYVEPISITPFTKKSVERYLSLYLATMIRHRQDDFARRRSAGNILNYTTAELAQLKEDLYDHFCDRAQRSALLGDPLLRNIITGQNVEDIRGWIDAAIADWQTAAQEAAVSSHDLVFSRRVATANPPQDQLYVDIDEYQEHVHSKKWQVPMSLRVIEPAAALKIKLK